MQILIYHGPASRKPLVAIAQVEWEGATVGVGTIGEPRVKFEEGPNRGGMARS